MASKPGGLNVRNSDDLEIHPARSLFAERFGEADPLNLLGKAADVGEVTGRCTLQPDGIKAQASWERLCRGNVGKNQFPAGARSNLQRSLEISGDTKSGEGKLVRRMSS